MSLNEYSRIRRTVSISKKLDDEIERIKKFPKWQGKRSPIFEAALEEYFEKHKGVEYNESN
jgi:metal-responsive CopG/Arc/MetJ family transcriptional regulator